jgi:hypothetical protein
LEKKVNQINPSDWFQAIKTDIKNKHGIGNPKFCIDNKKLSDAEFDAWLKRFVSPPSLWIKYIKKENDFFELKPFRPDPKDEISNKLIEDFLKDLSIDNQTYFTLNKYIVDAEDDENMFGFYKSKPGETFYNLAEIKVELRYLLRRGYSKISLKEKTKLDNKIIYHLHIEQDSLENMLKTGYLQLEYSDY